MIELDEHTGLEELSREECLRLLATQFIGRVALVGVGLPYIMPVNYALDAGRVVFRTTEESTFERLVKGTLVMFEIDFADPAYHTGWIVLGRGWAHEIVDPTDRLRAESLPLRPWARRLTDRRPVECRGVPNAHPSSR